MIGLKTYLPNLAAALRTSTAALYERQRALVRLGLLVPNQKRGPGGGVQMSADALAVLILALALTDNLSETDQRVRTLCEAKLLLGEKCRLTGKPTLRTAIGDVLSSQDLAARVTMLSVDRAELAGRIQYRAGGVKPRHSSFQQADRRLYFDNPWLRTRARVAGELFQWVAGDLALIAVGQKPTSIDQLPQLPDFSDFPPMR